MTAADVLIVAFLFIAAQGVLLLWIIHQRDEAREEAKELRSAWNAEKAHNDPQTASHWHVQRGQDAKAGLRPANWFDVCASDGSGGVPPPKAS